MRTDEGLPTAFTGSREWEKDRYDRKLFYGRNSFSGYERNHLFLNQQGRQFIDLSPLSGLDTDADSRSFAWLDYNRDGWLDIALVNANAPLFSLYRNDIGDHLQSNELPRPGMIAVSFVGGNASNQPAADLTARDGYGAVVEVDLGEIKIKREHRCGEGFAAQNSAMMIIGIGTTKVVPKLSVRWPSGKQQSIENVEKGTLLTVYEQEQQSPDQTAFVRTTYRNVNPAEPQFAVLRESRRLDLPAKQPGDGSSAADLHLYVAMASWCESCKRSMPQLEYVRKTFTPQQLAMHGVPIDPNDVQAKLEQYMAEYRPPYALVDHLSENQRQDFTTVLTESSINATPATVLADSQGKILQIMRGVPTVSDIARELQWQMESAQ